MGYFYDRVVAECPERSAYEERFACPGCLQWGDWGVKLASGGCIYCIYKIGFSEKQNIAATFSGGGDNI